MKKRVLRYLKHLGLTVLLLLFILITLGLSIDASIHYWDNETGYHVNHDGPYIFYKNDSTLSVNYLAGNREQGFYTESNEVAADADYQATCFFPLDSTRFSFRLQSTFNHPPVSYDDGEAIFAVSDIESGYKAFRDILISAGVIDRELQWAFGRGHLVLLGDFVDRGYSTTQVLWFIYKLEQDARAAGGKVHFIIGNHELKNMHGDYYAAETKYFNAATLLGRQQHDLYSPQSLIGRWMSSKNTVERINGILFTHGGLHPDLVNYKYLDLQKINDLIRKNYYQRYYPQPGAGAEQFLTSNETGPCWYRGYFKDDLEQEQIDAVLQKFGGSAIVVGHTLQGQVTTYYNEKVMAIDVKHPKDYQYYWPAGHSEGLMIEKETYYRLLPGEGKEVL
ncbi:metallophosphoesterase [Roseivirga sp. BDSF3-8]|uniref:metallophosphoesterase n=1 Tax=Roseivirga sp. BDSF3-8 TaxID=3241598 RepID=UPI00353231C4